MRLATDTGGTFTDLVVEDEDGAIRLYKASTVPTDPAQGVLHALQLAADDRRQSLESFLAEADTFVHGTTHAINAIVTGATARTALLVTAGHRDILTLREGGRSDPFNHRDPYPAPLTPRALTFEAQERILFDGSVERPLDAGELDALLDRVAAAGVEAIAVCLLWSIVNPAHERQIAAALDARFPGLPYTLSHALNPTPREYRRASSAVIDASLKPVMSAYISGLEGRLAAAGFRGRVLVLTSRGGMADAAEVAMMPIQVINSGPSVAPVAARHYSLAEGAATAIVADTGGTTYDIGLIRDGSIPVTREMWIGKPLRGHLIGVPSVDMRSVGAGGGSIAWVDAGGVPHVGPQSAGAQPGPACYGRGGRRATVTDAALVLGFIDPDFFLGGALQLDAVAAGRAIREDVAIPLGKSLEDAAAAVIEVVTENMVQAILDITITHGVDPRETVLIGGGGAAGLNSLYVARRLGVDRLLVPETGAVMSAAGALLSDLTAEFSDVCFTSTRNLAADHVLATLEALRARCDAYAAGPGAGAASVHIEIVAEARYENQVWEIDVPVTREHFADPDGVARFRAAFDARHLALFAVNDPRSDVELVSLRATVRCSLASRRSFRTASSMADVERGRRQVWFPGHGAVDTPVRQLDALPEGVRYQGPAILESAYTTVVIDAAAAYCRQASGSLVVTP